MYLAGYAGAEYTFDRIYRIIRMFKNQWGNFIIQFILLSCLKYNFLYDKESLNWSSHPAGMGVYIARMFQPRESHAQIIPRPEGTVEFNTRIFPSSLQDGKFLFHFPRIKIRGSIKPRRIRGEI